MDRKAPGAACLSMLFCFAHRAPGRAAAAALLGLHGACAALLFVALASPALAACGRPAGRVQVVGVDERLDLKLADGRTVRLGGLDVPNADRGAPETVSGARAF